MLTISNNILLNLDVASDSYTEELSILYEGAILGYVASAKLFLKILNINSWAWHGFMLTFIPTQKHL